MNMQELYFFAVGGTASQEAEILYVLRKARPEAQVILVILLLISIVAWSVMVYKAIQMRRAKKLNQFFTAEFKSQKAVLDMFDRRIQADGCPHFAVYQVGSLELDARLKMPDGGRKKHVTLKGVEHIKRGIENTVAQESLKLESGLILLAIAVSGGPFLGLLGTVWGVMSTFAGIANSASGTASLQVMAPGVSAALITTVAGLIVAIPSMFGYNWLVHNLRVLTVELDNFAQELVSKMETEYLKDE